MKFEELYIHEKVLEGIKAAGFTECTPVQALTLPDAVLRRSDDVDDVVSGAQNERVLRNEDPLALLADRQRGARPRPALVRAVGAAVVAFR